MGEAVHGAGPGGRATTDIAQAARAATAGAVQSILGDNDEVVPGTVGDDGPVTFAHQPGTANYASSTKSPTASFVRAVTCSPCGNPTARVTHERDGAGQEPQRNHESTVTPFRFVRR